MTFEKIVEAEVRRIKERLALAGGDGHFRLDIEASGRVDGDFKIEFSLGENYSGNNPTGHNLDAVVDEYIRRRNWCTVNQVKFLPNVELPVLEHDPLDDDDIPF
jgi:hypothetical protein